MQMHAKVRIDILIEAPFRARLTEFLDAQTVSGYTVFPALGGRGGEGSWSRIGQITDMGQMVQVTCVLDPASVDGLLDTLNKELAGQIGYVTTTEVNVIRPNKFP